jgi:transcription-repair coupling factor (superfamily II helicase)
VIAEDRLRLELYRRLAQCESSQEVYAIEEEIIDRFGALDTPTKQFIDVMNLKVLAKKEGISKISSYNNKVFIEYVDQTKPRTILEAKSRDDDDILGIALAFFHQKTREENG